MPSNCSISVRGISDFAEINRVLIASVTGKKPVRGLAVCIVAPLQKNVKAIWREQRLSSVELVGFVRSVDGPSKVTATVSLLGMYEDAMIKYISVKDEFKATLELDYTKEQPWVLTSLVPLPEQDRVEHSIQALEMFAAKREVTEGRRYPFKQDFCMMLRGDQGHSHDDGKTAEQLSHQREIEKILGRKHALRIVDAIHIQMDGLHYRFVPDEFSNSDEFVRQVTIAAPRRFAATIRLTVSNNLDLLKSGKPSSGATYIVGDTELTQEQHQDLLSVDVNAMMFMVMDLAGQNEEDDSDDSVSGTGA
jgi:hypothetical protein